jgi:hypothetical protein
VRPFDRFDQLRGISPLAAAINTLRGTYEGFDYALAKAKVAQMFALAFYREAVNRAGALVRTIPRRSMAYRAGLDLHSLPGTPPFAHSKTGAKVRRHLYYSYDPRARTVVVGPVPFGMAAGVPAVHEFGYSGMRVLRNRRRRKRRLGGVGEIRLVTKTKTVMADWPTGRDAVARQDTSTRAATLVIRRAATAYRATSWVILPIRANLRGLGKLLVVLDLTARDHAG